MSDIDNLVYDLSCVNTLRILSVDMIENAKSGHPGMPLGCAAILFTLFKNHLNFNPKDVQMNLYHSFVETVRSQAGCH